MRYLSFFFFFFSDYESYFVQAHQCLSNKKFIYHQIKRLKYSWILFFDSFYVLFFLGSQRAGSFRRRVSSILSHFPSWESGSLSRVAKQSLRMRHFFLKNNFCTTILHHLDPRKACSVWYNLVDLFFCLHRFLRQLCRYEYLGTTRRLRCWHPI